MRGGAHEPLPPQELRAKFADNARYGGWDETLAQEARAWCESVFTQPKLDGAVRFRG
jgi:hypothetical protein